MYRRVFIFSANLSLKSRVTSLELQRAVNKVLEKRYYTSFGKNQSMTSNSRISLGIYLLDSYSLKFTYSTAHRVSYFGVLHSIGQTTYFMYTI